jgi:hypothetical protein
VPDSTSSASPWIAVASGSAVLLVGGVAAAINGSWGFLAFLVLVTAGVTWQVSARVAERRGAVSAAQGRVLRHGGAIVFAIAAVVLGRIVAGS